MSGGSFDYLCYVEAEALSERLDDIQRMAERLAEMGHSVAASDTLAVAGALRSAFRMKERLRDVWHAMEWVDSGDWGPERMAEVMEAYARTNQALGSRDAHNDAVILAWGIIANAGGGDWSTQTQEWQQAARRWCDDFMSGGV